MSNITVIRSAEGRRVVNATTRALRELEIKYNVVGAKTKDEAEKQLLEQAPMIVNGMYRSNIIYESSTDGVMDYAVSYAPRNGNMNQDGESKESTLTFDCGGGSKKLKFAISTRKITPNSPDTDAIGWNGKTGADMEIDGVDIPIGQIRESYTRVIKMARLTNDYKRVVAKMVGKVNSKRWKGWEQGEVMFLGMTFQGSTENASLVTVTYNFQIQVNETDVKIGDVTVGAKKGWEYLWCIFRTVKKAMSPNRVRPDGVYVSTVTNEVDFGALGV